jgi:hypothetical protein
MSVFMAMIAGLKTEVVARCSLALENVALHQHSRFSSARENVRSYGNATVCSGSCCRHFGPIGVRR